MGEHAKKRRLEGASTAFAPPRLLRVRVWYVQDFMDETRMVRKPPEAPKDKRINHWCARHGRVHRTARKATKRRERQFRWTLKHKGRKAKRWPLVSFGIVLGLIVVWLLGTVAKA